MKIILKIIWNILALVGLLTVIGLSFGLWWLNSNFPGVIPFFNNTDQTETSDHPLLNDQQQKSLETIGVDTSALPSEITPEMETCFEGVLGVNRVNEIKQGDSPTAIEYFKAKDCL